MRIRTGLVLGLLLVLGVAGCGKANSGDKVATAGGQRSTTSSAKPNGLAPAEAALKFAQCMREHGINMPDPKAGSSGEFSINLPDGTDPTKADAATQQCKQYMPNGGEPQKMDPQRLEQMQKFAKCMRDNGVPNFQDPDPNGGMKVEQHSAGDGSSNSTAGGIDPNDPKFKAAEQACAKYQPAGQGPGTSSGGKG